MGRQIFTGLGLLAAGLGLILITAPPPVPAQETRGRAIRVGLISSLYRGMPEPVMQVCMKPLKTLLEDQTGLPGELVAGGDAGSLARQLKESRVQLAIFHGIEFAWARLKHPELKPLIVALHFRPALHAVLVVPADSSAEKPADLRGQAVALAADSREHCRVFFERRCVPVGGKPSQFFGRVAQPEDVEEMLDDVVDGKYAGAVVDEIALQGFAKMKPGRAARLKTLVKSEAFPCAVIAYHPGTADEGMLQRFREGLIAAKSTRRGQQMLTMCRITAFADVPDNYDQLLSDIAKAYPPPAAK